MVFTELCRMKQQTTKFNVTTVIGVLVGAALMFAYCAIYYQGDNLSNNTSAAIDYHYYDFESNTTLTEPTETSRDIVETSTHSNPKTKEKPSPIGMMFFVTIWWLGVFLWFFILGPHPISIFTLAVVSLATLTVISKF